MKKRKKKILPDGLFFRPSFFATLLSYLGNFGQFSRELMRRLQMSQPRGFGLCLHNFPHVSDGSKGNWKQKLDCGEKNTPSISLLQKPFKIKLGFNLLKILSDGETLGQFD